MREVVCLVRFVPRLERSPQGRGCMYPGREGFCDTFGALGIDSFYMFMNLI